MVIVHSSVSLPEGRHPVRPFVHGKNGSCSNLRWWPPTGRYLSPGRRDRPWLTWKMPGSCYHGRRLFSVLCGPGSTGFFHGSCMEKTPQILTKRLMVSYSYSEHQNVINRSTMINHDQSWDEGAGSFDTPRARGQSTMGVSPQKLGNMNAISSCSSDPICSRKMTIATRLRG